MTTEPSLHEDVRDLTEEIRALTARFSAKEDLADKAKELAEKTARITHNWRVVLIVVSVAFALVLTVVAGAVVVVYQNVSCQARFNKATEQRSALLTMYTQNQSDAMGKLVEARGLPNDEAIIQARDAWIDATWYLDEGRRLNPVPKYEGFCRPVWGVDSPKVPPVVEPGPLP